MKDTENKNIRILQFVRVLDKGGIESFIFNNLSEMNLKLFQMDFLVTRDQSEAYDDKLQMLDCNKIVVIMKYENVPILKHFERFFKLYYFFKKSDYDIVHFHSVGPYLLSSISILAAKLGGVSCRIVHSHQGKHDFQLSRLEKIKRLLGRSLNAKWGTHFFACSDNAALYAFPKRLIYDNKVTYIKNAVDFTRFFYSAQIRDTWRSKLGLNEKYVLGSIARFVKFKNHEFMVKILESVLKEKKNVVLLLVGGEIAAEPYVRQNLMDLVKSKNLEENVIFYGETDHVAELLNAMDVFLMPSFYEGFPLAGIEAQCTGIQFLASSYITRSLKVTENCHFLSIDGPIDNWVKAIIECNQDYDRKDMGLSVRKEGYDVKETAMQLENLYIKMVEG